MIAFLLFLLGSPAPSPLAGQWITPDKSVVRVYPCGEQLCMEIAAIGRPNDPRKDIRNPDASLRNRALCGLTIGTAFVPDGSDAAKNGKIYDPASGKTYSAQMQLRGDTLLLRGYVGISLLGRTESWHRLAGAAPACH